MSLLIEFRNTLQKKYLFHLHTKYTDGESTVEQYCFWAQKNGYKAVIFTEHVRQDLLYDFEAFLFDIKRAKKQFLGMDIWVGIEAKILLNGEIDIPNILDDIQLIGFAFHSFPLDIIMYEKSAKRVFMDKRWKKHIRVWLHPGLYFEKLKVIDDQLTILNNLVIYALKEGVFIEQNTRYNLPPPHIIRKIPKSMIIKGLDLHSYEKKI